MIIKSINGINEWVKLKEEYLSLLDKCEKKNVFMQYEYLNTWLHRPKNKNEEPLLLVGYLNDNLIGIAPFVVSYERKLGVKISTIYNMGYGLSDILDWIIAPSHEEEFCKAVLNTIYKTTNCKIIRLGSITKNCSIYTPLSKLNVINNWQCIKKKETVSPYLITDSQHHLTDKLQERKIKDSEYILRRMEREGGIEYLSIKDEKEIEKWLEIFYNMHVIRWDNTKTPSRFKDSAEREYFTTLARVMLKKISLELNVLKFKSLPIAIHFGFSDSDRFYYYLTTYDVNYNKYSPGNTLIYLLIKDANQRGIRCFDFLRGNETYKNKWSNTVDNCYSMNLLRKRFNKIILLMERGELVLSNPTLIIRRIKKMITLPGNLKGNG